MAYELEREEEEAERATGNLFGGPAPKTKRSEKTKANSAKSPTKRGKKRGRRRRR